jgi:predicted transcriptional regulator
MSNIVDIAETEITQLQKRLRKVSNRYNDMGLSIMHYPPIGPNLKTRSDSSLQESMDAIRLKMPSLRCYMSFRSNERWKKIKGDFAILEDTFDKLAKDVIFSVLSLLTCVWADTAVNQEFDKKYHMLFDEAMRIIYYDLTGKYGTESAEHHIEVLKSAKSQKPKKFVKTRDMIEHDALHQKYSYRTMFAKLLTMPVELGAVATSDEIIKNYWGCRVAKIKNDYPASVIIQFIPDVECMNEYDIVMAIGAIFRMNLYRWEHTHGFRIPNTRRVLEVFAYDLEKMWRRGEYNITSLLHLYDRIPENDYSQIPENC